MALVFRMVHGGIGITQQILNSHTILGRDRNPHTGGDENFLSLKIKRFYKTVQQAGGESHNLLSLTDISQSYGKFIATHAGNFIVGTQAT